MNTQLPILIQNPRGGMPRMRDVEPPGFIHLPKLGLVAHSRIHHFESDRNYCRVYLKGDKNEYLLSEGLCYFERRLPDFVRVSRYRLENHDLL